MILHPPTRTSPFLPALIATAVACIHLIALLSAALTHPQDVNALIELYHAWNDNELIAWDISKDPCGDSWLGVACVAVDSQYDRVTSLLLVNQGLTGTLPAVIGDLTNLTYLDLSYNPSLGGSLPTSLGSLGNVERLYLQACNFSGGIPSEIGSMSKLQYLIFSNNSLTGPLPDTVGYLTNMIWFDASYNLLSGSLPVSDSSLNNIGLDNMTISQHIHLQGNKFSGTIPASLFQPYMRLLHLMLAENQFTGSIPTNINNLQHLDIIRLDNNLLTGTIPTTINTITNLTTLQLNNNNLSGAIPSLSNNTKLEILMLQSNALDGTFDLTGVNSSVLKYMDVSNNDIQNLVFGDYNTTNGDSITLLVYGNPFCNNGSTTTIAKCEETSGTQTSTPTVYVNGCSPCKDSPIERVNPNNKDDCLCARPVMVTWSFYALKVTDLTELSAENIVTLRQTFWTMWDASQFTKSLQPPLQVNQIDIVATAYDALNISIFPPVGNSEWGDNEATIISFVLQNQDIWFSSIGPMISIFWTGPYKNNSGGNQNSLNIGAKIGIGLGASIAFIALMLVGVYAMKQRKRALEAEELAKPFSSWITSGNGRVEANIPMLKGARWFSFREILNCTNNFHTDNEIGVGGYGKVYKGHLPSSEVVAIKRSNATSLQGAAEFKNEIELLSRVHHRNLVGLIGFCFEEGEQILVYKFMPNGTLRECLKDPTKIRMTWAKRIDLALNAARGIAYLHYEADPPIIHRDIKSNNILLDENFVAMVADFGLSKLSPKDGDENMTSINVKGTIGYLDPSYYMTSQLTNKSDVYSFGVVLFELITGKPPINGGVYIVSVVRVAFKKGGLDQVIAQSLLDSTLNNYPFEYLQRFLQLAISCVDDDPEQRPSMNKVVKELENIQLYSHQLGNGEKQDHTTLSIDHKNVEYDFDMSSSNMSNARDVLYGKNAPYLQQDTESSSFDISVNCEALFKPIDPK